MLIHHTSDTYSEFQVASALNSEKEDSLITHVLAVMAIFGLALQIKINNALHVYPIKCNNF